MTQTRKIILNPRANEYAVQGDGVTLAGQELVDVFTENSRKLNLAKDWDTYLKEKIRSFTIGNKPHIFFEKIMDGFIHVSASNMSAEHSSLNPNYVKELLWELLSTGVITRKQYNACFKKPQRQTAKVTVGDVKKIKLYDMK